MWPVCVRAARTRALCSVVWRAPPHLEHLECSLQPSPPGRAAGESQAKPHTSPSLSVTFVQYYMLDRMDSTSNAHSIETGAGDRGRESRPSGVHLHEELTLAHRRGTQDTHRTGAGRTHRGSTAVGAQRGAAMHLPEKIGWQSSGAQLYPRPCRASLGRDSSSVQPPRTNPALASVSGASRRSRAAPGRRSLIIAAIASAAMAIAVTPPLGTVLVAHAGSVRGGRARQHGRAAAIGIATAAIAVSASSGGDGGGGEEEEVDAASAGGGGARLPTQIILSAAPTENGNDRENDQVQIAIRCSSGSSSRPCSCFPCRAVRTKKSQKV